MRRKHGACRFSVGENIRCELCEITAHLSGVILSAAAGAALLILGYILFGGPCRVVMFFRIPGGGFAVVMHYVLWILMFAAAGAELYLLKCISGRSSGEAALYHLAAHLCMFIWYPLFFTTMAQFLALIVIGTAAVLSVLAAKSARAVITTVCVSMIVKAAVCAIYFYINLAFLIIN